MPTYANIWPTHLFQIQLFIKDPIISCHGSVKLKRLGPEALHITLKRVASVASVSKILHVGPVDIGCWDLLKNHLRYKKRLNDETAHCIESLMAVLCPLAMKVVSNSCGRLPQFETCRFNFKPCKKYYEIKPGLNIKGHSSTWPVCFSSIFPLVPSTWLTIRLHSTKASCWVLLHLDA